MKDTENQLYQQPDLVLYMQDRIVDFTRKSASLEQYAPVDITSL